MWARLLRACRALLALGLLGPLALPGLALGQGTDAAVFVQLGHAAPVQAVAVSPDGQWLISGDSSGALVVWDTRSQRELRRLQAPWGVVLHLAFVDNSRFVWSSGTFGEGQLHLSDLDGRTLGRAAGVHQAGITGLVVDRLGRIYSSDEAGLLVRWAPDLSAVAARFDTLGAAPSVLRAAPDGHLLLGTADGRVMDYLDDVSPGAPNPTLSPGTNQAAEGQRPPRVSWQAGSEPVKDIARHPAGDTAVAFGRLSGSTLAVVRVFNPQGQLQREIGTGPGRASALAYSPDGHWLLVMTDRNLAALASGASFKDHESLLLFEARRAVRTEARPDGQNAIGPVPAPVSRHVREAFARGTPAVRGQLQFSPDGQDVFVAAWDERPRSFRLAPPARQGAAVELVELAAAYRGHGQALRWLAPLGEGQLLTADAQGTASGGPPLSLTDFVAEFGGPAQWGSAAVEQLRPRFSPWLSPTRRYAVSRWSLATGRLEQVAWPDRARSLGLVPLQDGSVDSLSVMFPEFVALPPLRNDLVRSTRMQPAADGMPLASGHFGADPQQADAGVLQSVEPGAAAPPFGLVTLVAVSADGGTYAAVVAQDKAKGAEGAPAGPATHALVVFRHQEQVDAGGASPGRVTDRRWRRVQQRVLPEGPLALALSRDGALAWVSGAPAGVPGQSLHDPTRTWLQAVATSDGQVLAALRPPAVAEALAPIGDGRRVALSGGPAVAIAEIGQADFTYLRLPQAEAAMRRLAVSADGGELLAATPNNTYLWDIASGQLRLSLPQDTMAAEALGFTPSLLLTGHADGSVAVRRRSNGELLVRLIRLAGDQWLSITPEGYFAGSALGDQVVNVRVGRQVLGISQFYDVFYRPDLVQRKLAGEDIRPLVRVTLDDALRQPPPHARLMLATPGLPGRLDSTRPVLLRFQADSAGGGVGELRLYHNGKLVQRSGTVLARTAAGGALGAVADGVRPASPGGKGLPAEADRAATTRALMLQVDAEREEAAETRRRPVQQLAGTRAIRLVPGPNSIALVATNSDGSVASRPQLMQLDVAGQSRPGRIHLVTLGIDRFDHRAQVPTLHYAVKDADDIDQRLGRALRSSFPDRPLLQHRLRNDQATTAGVARLVARLRKQVGPDDLVVWFVASHGVLDSRAQYAIVLHDWQRAAMADGEGGAGDAGDSGNVAAPHPARKPAPATGLLRAEAILAASQQIAALRQVYILDTCHAGGMDASIAGLYDARLSVLARNMGLHLLASASATQEALDGYQGNGLFTHTLLGGLAGAAVDSNQDRFISVAELAAYAGEETSRIARQLRHAQRPLRLHFGNDIALERSPHAAAAQP